jgi:undecaprenyl phosphate-alpha-L-ara4N flippase subunit ArnE
MQTELWAIGLVMIAVVLSSIEAVFWKKGSNNIHRNIMSFIGNKYLYIAGSFAFVGSITFIISLRGGDLSVLYPISSVKYVLISILSMKIFNEKMNPKKWIGIALIILGVSLIGISI